MACARDRGTPTAPSETPLTSNGFPRSQRDAEPACNASTRDTTIPTSDAPHPRHVGPDPRWRLALIFLIRISGHGLHRLPQEAKIIPVYDQQRIRRIDNNQ